MGEQSTSLHRANATKKGGPTWGSQDRHHLAQVDFVQGKGLLLIGFIFYRSHGDSLETGLIIGSIAVLSMGALKWVAWSYRSSRAQTIASLHHLSWFLFVLSFEVLGLVVISVKSSSTSKTDFICLFYCVFGVGGFTNLIRGRVPTIFSWDFSKFIFIVISIKFVLALVASFPKNLVYDNPQV